MLVRQETKDQSVLKVQKVTPEIRVRSGHKVLSDLRDRKG